MCFAYLIEICVHNHFNFFFEELIKGGWSKSGWELGNFSKINKLEGEDYSIIERTVDEVRNNS